MGVGVGLKLKENMKKKIVYIAHPIGGDVEGNLKSIQSIYDWVSYQHQDEVIPFVPYYATVMSLDDNNPSAREVGMMHNKHFFDHGIIDEVWLYGDRISKGMAQEIEWAEKLGIPVVSKSKGTKG